MTTYPDDDNSKPGIPRHGTASDKNQPPRREDTEDENEADIALREQREKIQRISSEHDDPSTIVVSPDLDSVAPDIGMPDGENEQEQVDDFE